MGFADCRSYLWNLRNLRMINFHTHRNPEALAWPLLNQTLLLVVPALDAQLQRRLDRATTRAKAMAGIVTEFHERVLARPRCQNAPARKVQWAPGGGPSRRQVRPAVHI